MKPIRLHALALILGVTTGLLTMAVHPTHIDFEASLDGINQLSDHLIAVHVLGLISVPLWFFGLIGLSKRLGPQCLWSTGANIAFAMACLALTIAAVADGIIGPNLITQAAAAEEPKRLILMSILHYNFEVNQAFAKLYVVTSAVAFSFWSIALAKLTTREQFIGYFGLAVSLISVVALASGLLHLDAHGFGLIVLLQALWCFAVAINLFFFEIRP